MIRQKWKNKTPRMRKLYAGFTLVETLVAIGVLMAAVTGTLTVASRGIALTGVSRDNIVAFYLAQEPIEFIRKFRDTNAIDCLTNNTCADPGFDWLVGPSSDSDLSECIGQWCIVDVHESNSNNQLTTCVGACSQLRFRDSTGEYSYFSGGGSVVTPFVRQARINVITAGREAEIEVRVSWPQGLTTKTITLRENIFNRVGP